MSFKFVTLRFTYLNEKSRDGFFTSVRLLMGTVVFDELEKDEAES